MIRASTKNVNQRQPSVNHCFNGLAPAWSLSTVNPSFSWGDVDVDAAGDRQLVNRQPEGLAMTDHKQCPDCGKTLPATTENFYPSTSTWGGIKYATLTTRCRPCHLEFNRLRRERLRLEAASRPGHTGPRAGTVERIFFCQVRGVVG